MRAASLSGPATAGFSCALLLNFLTIFQAVPTLGLSFTSVSEPQLDLSPLGRVAFTGDFDAVSIYSYTEQSKTASVNNDGQSILTLLPNGELTALSSPDAQIRAMCAFTRKDGTYEGIFVGGNFTKLGGVETEGAALYKPDSNEVTPLPGLSGSVSALLCDQETNSVYVGGYFKYENTSNAVAWVGGEGWKTLSFDGLKGPVESILKNDNGHIIFAGSFDGVGNSTSSNQGQIVNLQNATITSDAISSRSGYSDPRNVICQTSGEDGEGKTWLLADYSPGFWRADMGFEYRPTKLRLYNTHFEGRGTKTFLFRRLPDNGIMNLTYTDPNTGYDVHCDQRCPLSDSTDEKYRDFEFVNVVGMSGFQIEILDWYGAGAGLNGIELFQEEIFAYAVDAFNEPTCASIKYPSKATRTGSWSTTESPFGSGQSSSEYLTAHVTDSTADSTSVVFEPDVKQSGNYSILLYTPGCTEDGTCGSRGIVNVTVSVTTDSNEPIQTVVYQTNLYEKYDTIYTGRVDASGSSFRPQVKLTPVAGQGDITVVASRVQFVLTDASSNSSSGDLNGLFEYDPTSTVASANLTQSAVDKAGLQLDSGASVKALAKHDNTIYAGGNFSDSSIHNIMFFSDGNVTAMAGGGLNSEVTSMAVLDDFLYVGGNFTDTSDGSNQNLNHVAAYSFDTKSWSTLGGGVNGPVDWIIPLQLNISTDLNETVVAVSGDFNRILPFGNESASDVSGFAVWVPSHKNWLANLNVTHIEYAGQLTAYAKHGNTSMLAGNLASGGIAAAGAVALLYNDGMNLDPLLTKVGGTNTSAGTFAGTYDTNSGRNLTILGGHFTTTASDGSAIQNLAILNGTDNTVRGIGSGLDNNSTFLTLTVSDDTLFAGGNVTGTVGNSMINGFVAYNLKNESFVENVPPPFTGKDVSVNAIAARPGTTEIYFGGNFQNAGALPCPAVCFYDTTEAQWTRPGVTLYGNVLSLKWTSNNQLIAVGNLTVSGNQTVVATYNAKDQSWEELAGASTADNLGTVTAFTPANTDVSRFWLAGESKNGSSFLASYDGSNLHFAGSIFGDGTTIRAIEILPLSQTHRDVSVLNDDQDLLVIGELVIPDFGNASAALFNGTTLTPFLLSSKWNGQSGSMTRMFYENKNPYTSGGHHHSNGIVVLVAFCCALGCVFLIVFAGVIFNKIQRRRQGYMRAPQAYGTDRPSTMRRLPPEYLFNTLKHPNPVVFVDNSDPSAEELEVVLGESEAAVLASRAHQKGLQTPSSSDGDIRGLEHLSTAGSTNQYPFSPLATDNGPRSLAPDHSAHSNILDLTVPSISSGSSTNRPHTALAPQPSPPISISSFSNPNSNNTNNDIKFILNPSQTLSPPVDPSNQPSEPIVSSIPSRSVLSRSAGNAEQKSELPVETEYEVVFLLRHFSEAPGLWMDLFDLGTYFASLVPVKALTNPLLKYAACAYAAKQLGRVKGAKAPFGGISGKQAFTESWPDGRGIDWTWCGAKYYEKAIQLLVNELQPDEGPPPLSTPEAFGQWQAAELCQNHDNSRKRRRHNRPSSGVHSDEVLAATAILSIYEFLDATGTAWNRHLSGVKSLLDVAEVGMLPFEQHPSPGDGSLQPPRKLGLSRARRATFWNFARQDYLAAFINETQTRLNTEDVVLWTEAGLQLDSMGFVRTTNFNAAGYPEEDDEMKEDLISNALVWIASKIVNFIGAGDTPHLTHAGAVTAGQMSLSQQALLERWHRLEAELDTWYKRLPTSFRPCARIDLSNVPHPRTAEDEDAASFSEIWFSIPMCSSAIQHYHMARILLLINKPHDSINRRSAMTNRLNSYRSIENEIRFHSREIVGISLARPHGSVRINSLQPLFVSGQCLTQPRERRVVLRLLRGIEADLGWATEYRVKQLLREWGWDEASESTGGS
ncbi:hypothetical protein CFD26_103894 [Aspergillus turcosus]|uniref:Uncharacterized protein n=1 Tax=Aspergillus turcosus TaxID=1245748 RepID=A0A421D4L3_9EURO|nr:hypothetical protein CFD26_103894 [Aspergillus turcosus]